MKKNLFTLFGFLLFNMGTYAQAVYNISTIYPTATTIPSAGATKSDLTIYPGVSNTIDVKIVSNGKSTSDGNYTGLKSCIKLGGAGLPTTETYLPTQRYISIPVTGSSKITAYGMSESAGQSMTLIITDGTKQLGSYTTSLSSSTVFPVTGDYTGDAGTVYLYADNANYKGFYVFLIVVEPTTPKALPTLTTNEVSDILANSATCGGDVTLEGLSSVTDKGVCWNTSANPTIDHHFISNGSGTGNFISSMTGLTASTMYYVRAYATNNSGTSYGNEVSFTTGDGLPIVATNSANDIRLNSATCGGNVTSDGGSNITSKGVCWNTSAKPTIDNNHTSDGSGTGSYISSIAGLGANATYYVRAFATNDNGTSYGNEVSFTTSELPAITTNSVSNMFSNSITCGGNIFSDGGYSVIVRGVCYSTSANPTINDNYTTDGSGTGNYISTISGLAANTTYHIRSYATNSKGTGYGQELTFTTPSFTIEAESMTLSGKYCGTISNPFSGIAMYANSDQAVTSSDFPDGTGYYLVSMTGASSNTSSAGVSLYVNGKKLKAFSFTGKSAAFLQAKTGITTTGSPMEIKLLLETDNGSSDTYVDNLSFAYLGPLKNPPVLPKQGAYYTNTYRNVFVEAGYSNEEVQNKLDTIWQHFFYGDSLTQRIYYPVGTDEAYIYDSGNSDVRSEGMSYGMMICVQMNKQEEFNRLWKWAKTHMQHQTGIRQGYFSWDMNTDGTIKDQNPAPDGEEYFVMSLMFASKRWGNGTGIYNYWQEANDILDAVMNKENPVQQSVMNMVNTTENQVVFVPYGSSANYTDPSYHLPAFYQLWSLWADSNRTLWANVAAKSREMFGSFANSVTGLMPDYAKFDGTPTGSNHADFRFDAWRCMMNMAVDFSWFQAESSEYDIINRTHTFFKSEGIDSYGNQYSLTGSKLSADHSPGLVACNAAGALASDKIEAWDFIEDFYNVQPTTGKYRYYDGMLYLMNYLHLSGNFKIYGNYVTKTINPEEDVAIENRVYPNPATDYIYVQHASLYSSYKLIHAETGIIVRTGLISSGQIDVKNLHSGLYILGLVNKSTQTFSFNKVLIKN